MLKGHRRQRVCVYRAVPLRHHQRSAAYSCAKENEGVKHGPEGVPRGPSSVLPEMVRMPMGGEDPPGDLTSTVILYLTKAPCAPSIPRLDSHPPANLTPPAHLVPQ